jgi:predicted nucleic acid-binding protein
LLIESLYPVRNGLVTIPGVESNIPGQPREGLRGVATNFILLDTSVLTEARKTDEKLNDDLVFFFRQVPAGALAVPHAAIFELQRGACNIGRRDPLREQLYNDWLDQLLATDIWLPPVDVSVRRLLAKMTMDTELSSFWISQSRKPKMMFGCDPEIAATAIVHGLPIASTDVHDFLRIHRKFPLPGLYSPVSGKWHVDPPDGWYLGENIEPDERDWHSTIGPIEYRR